VSKNSNSDLLELAGIIDDFFVKRDIGARTTLIVEGPVFTTFNLELQQSVGITFLSLFKSDLARMLAVEKIEICPSESPDFEVCIRLVNKVRYDVAFQDLVNSDEFINNPSPLSIILGVNTVGKTVITDLNITSHVIISGTTGAGKTTCMDSIILSLLYKSSPDTVRLLMIDPLLVDLTNYEKIPHLLADVFTDMRHASNAINWCYGETNRRIKLISSLRLRDLKSYNDNIDRMNSNGSYSSNISSLPLQIEKEPYIVIFISDFFELWKESSKDIQEKFSSLLLNAHKTGIYFVIATSRPSSGPISNLIKNYISSHIVLTLASVNDSKALGFKGAESLLGKGDMFFISPEHSSPQRIQGVYANIHEINATVAKIKQHTIHEVIPDSSKESEANDLDPLFDQAVEYVIEKRHASISGVQRQFRIGYNRAAQIIEQMEEKSIVSAPGHNGNREVLAPPPWE
jgi:S-DNA-T family DNA segregation ATPase FtsK/SpoIIIE